MRESVADWSLAPVVEALQAMRGIDVVGAASLLAELGDLSRFESPSQLMAFLGLTPSERSTGDSVKRGSITKAGNSRARRLLVEAAWSYRTPYGQKIETVEKLEVVSAGVAGWPRLRFLAHQHGCGLSGDNQDETAYCLSR